MATCMAVGNVSLELWPRLTSSFGCTPSEEGTTELAGGEAAGGDMLPYSSWFALRA